MGAFGGPSKVRASGFHPSSVQTPPGPVPGVGRRGFEGEVSKTDADSPRNVPGVYNETKSKHLTRVFMWATNIFFSSFFGHFRAGIFG
jgi:hypothetical protein